jgi:pilus assembly protein Flp/PilA
MLNFLVTLQTFITDRVERTEKGATAVEYGLMVSLIAVAIIITVRALGLALDGIFAAVVAAL